MTQTILAHRRDSAGAGRGADLSASRVVRARHSYHARFRRSHIRELARSARCARTFSIDAARREPAGSSARSGTLTITSDDSPVLAREIASRRILWRAVQKLLRT